MFKEELKKTQSNKEEKINLERRYISVGFFLSVFLFKQKLVRPYYSLKGAGNIFINSIGYILKFIKLLVWKGK